MADLLESPAVPGRGQHDGGEPAALDRLDDVAGIAAPAEDDPSLRDVMELLMVTEPQLWQNHDGGRGASLAAQRHCSYSDRIRYHWSHPQASAVVAALMARLGDGVRDGTIRPVARDLVIAAIRAALRPCSAA